MNHRHLKLSPGITYIIKDDSCYLNIREQIVLPNDEMGYQHKKIKLKKGDELEFIGRKSFPIHMIDYRDAHYFSVSIGDDVLVGEFHPILYKDNFEKYLEKKPGIFSDLLNS